MNHNPLILGADIRPDSLILSGTCENQKELINENFVLSKDRDAEELVDVIRVFLKKNFDCEDADYLIYSCEGYPLPKCRNLERTLRQQGIGN